jgi:hypothetical protein
MYHDIWLKSFLYHRYFTYPHTTVEVGDIVVSDLQIRELSHGEAECSALSNFMAGLCTLHVHTCLLPHSAEVGEETCGTACYKGQREKTGEQV